MHETWPACPGGGGGGGGGRHIVCGTSNSNIALVRKVLSILLSIIHDFIPSCRSTPTDSQSSLE